MSLWHSDLPSNLIQFVCRARVAWRQAWVAYGYRRGFSKTV